MELHRDQQQPRTAGARLPDLSGSNGTHQALVGALPLGAGISVKCARESGATKSCRVVSGVKPDCRPPWASSN